MYTGKPLEITQRIHARLAVLTRERDALITWCNNQLAAYDAVLGELETLLDQDGSQTENKETHDDERKSAEQPQL